MECDKKKMAFTRPSSGMRRLESTRSPLPHFAARTGYEIVDAVPAGVLKVVFVTAETCANAARLEQRNNGRHSIGVAMLGAGTERRVMAKRNAPSDRVS